MSLRARAMRPDDDPVWADMAHALWAENPCDAPLAGFAATPGAGIGGRRGFIAEDHGGAVGFAEIGLRPYANALS